MNKENVQRRVTNMRHEGEAKKSNERWIVITSVQKPTSDVKMLSALQNWNVVVVGDTKTPSDWSYKGVHYLSIEKQLSLNFSITKQSPTKSYTRKNIGYLYAISKGAKFIYDTDDDNQPFDNGLDEFDYSANVSGLLFSSSLNETNLFNPYRYFGNSDMWPRGFPLEEIHDHKNCPNRMRLCDSMRLSAVQQGLVQHDPDVDAIYRLQYADKKVGLAKEFNEHAPPIVLEKGTYSPFNSQNTLYNYNAFFALFLPTTVEFRVTDIWRSYFAQALLHLTGETVAFTPVNAVQYRNPHSFLKDFQEESDVYLKSGKIVNFISKWKCNFRTLEQCIIQLAEEFHNKGFWGGKDVELIRMWIEDLKLIGYKFPALKDVKTKGCRKAELAFNEVGRSLTTEMIRSRVIKKNAHAEELIEFCSRSNAKGFDDFPIRAIGAQVDHIMDSFRIVSKIETALIITSNTPWRYQAIGHLQRLYQAHFAVTIFCGTFSDEILKRISLMSSGEYDETEGIEVLPDEVNYIHLDEKEMNKGFQAYHCMSKTRNMRLRNIRGFFMMSDDVVFNLWQPVDLTTVTHATGIYNHEDWGDSSDVRKWTAKAIELLSAVKNTKTRVEWDKRLQKHWSSKYLTLESYILEEEWTTASDWFYIPSHELDFFSDLMEIFYEAKMFHEFAIGKYLRAVKYNIYGISNGLYLEWYQRPCWHEIYSKDLLMMHPVKLGEVLKTKENIREYCLIVIRPHLEVLLQDLKAQTASYYLGNGADIIGYHARWYHQVPQILHDFLFHRKPS